MHYHAAIEKKFLAIISAFFMKSKKKRGKPQNHTMEKGEKIRMRKKQK